MVLQKEQCAEFKKGHFRYCCNQVWMNIGGRIPWNVIAICEILRINLLMGKHRSRGDLVNHLQDRSFFWFVGRISSNIPRGPGTNPSIWKESAPWDIPWLCIVRGGQSGKKTYWSRILRRWKRWMHQISMLKDSMRKR